MPTESLESTTNVVNKAWPMVSAMLQEQLSGPSYDTWVVQLTLVSATPQQFDYHATSLFHKNWVLKHYKGHFDIAHQRTASYLWGDSAGYMPAMAIETIFTSEQQTTGEHNADAILSLQQLDDRAWTPRSADSQLNPKYTFDSFVVSTHNRLCHAVAVAVSEAPAQSYNPFFIYGPVGLGKTHLMQAIGHYVHRHHPQLAVRYLTAEQFTNELIHALGSKQMTPFREKYRKIDLLLMDDVQFLEGKERTQEELFHTFNTLHQAGKQIVLSSDRPPKSLSSLEDRLRSRFEWGLIADIQPPDLETRIAILQKKAERDGLLKQIPMGLDVLTYVAECFPNNIRELEGALNRLVAQALLDKGVMDLLAARQVLGHPDARPPLTMSDILQAVGEYFHVKITDLRGPGRSKDVSRARQVGCHLIREHLGVSYPKIGEYMGGRNHASILYACERIREDLITSPVLETQIKELNQRLRHR